LHRAAWQSSKPSAGIYRCAFPFTFDNVPEVPFYSIEISQRGAISYSLAEMSFRIPNPKTPRSPITSSRTAGRIK